MNPRRLYRSRDRQLAGVAGGMAEYLDIDPTIMRIAWIVVGLVSAGLALIAYFLLALIIPQAPVSAAPGMPGGWTTAPGGPGAWGPGTPGATAAQGTTWAPPAAPSPGWPTTAYTAPAYTAPAYAAPARRSDSRGIGFGAIVGVVLVVIGTLALADVALPAWSINAAIGPAVLLALGAALLLGAIRRPAEEAPAATSTSTATGTETAPADVTSSAAPLDATDVPVTEPGSPDQGDPAGRG